MKNFLGGMIIILIIVGIGYNYESKNNQFTVTVPQESVKEVITYKELLEYTSIFKTGDIINIENSNYLSSYAIPGRWKHTIFYLGTYQQFIQAYQPEDKYYNEINNHYQTKQEILVLDSNSTGVKIRTFDQMANLKEDSYLKALSGYRFNENNDFLKAYLNRALDYLGIPYDYSMTTYDDRALYCSELVYYALLANNIEVTKTSDLVEHVVITPTDLGDFLEELSNVDHVYLLEKDNNLIIDKIND